MDAPIPDASDRQQVARFLDKICRDCDAELQDIARRRDAEIARLRADAHAEARRLFRQAARQLRARLGLETGRYLARLRTDLRRQRWAILDASQQRLLDAIATRFREAWQDPERQWQWSRFWLRAALQRAGDEPLAVTLGNGALESIGERIEREIRARAADATVIIDPRAEPGILIEWGDYLIDGRLASQSPAIADAVLGRLSRLLYATDREPAS